jgi:hypothetical protein
MGLELQIEELIEQQKRAVMQERTEDARRLGQEVAGLQTELAATAERVADLGPVPERAPELHYAEELAVEEDE